MENKESFNYTYSAKEQEEIKAIRKKYAVQEQTEDKMAQLRRLDAGVYSKATTAALVVGIIGALIMGMGMSLIMTEIGAFLGTVMAMIVGISLGIIGIILVCLAYPLYNRTLKKEREKIAPEILRLTDELMK
jgi:ABC-type antimicrobial peptide transport system permease subunit